MFIFCLGFRLSDRETEGAATGKLGQLWANVSVVAAAFSEEIAPKERMLLENGHCELCMLPGMCLIATSLINAQADNALDIVLNSAAV